MPLYQVQGFNARIFVRGILSLFGFYASTLTRGMVPALAAGAVVSIVFFMVNQFASHATYAFGWRLWPVVAEPALLVAVVWLAFGNFRYVFESGRQWRRNILGLIAVLAVTSGSLAAVYHRVWELAMPLEEPHGPARLPVGKYPLLGGYYNSSILSIKLPDKRLWQDRIEQQTGRSSVRESHFIPGSNWVDAIALSEEMVAIRSDGTLWVSEKPQQIHVAHDLPPLVQFGVETDWQNVACDSESMVVLLKRDATLWRFERNSANPKTYHGLRTLTPHRLGATSDWARILPGARWIYAWKRDGTAWHLQEIEPGEAGSQFNKFQVILDPITAANRLPELDHTYFQSLNLPPALNGINLGVRDNGTLWYWDWDGHKVRQIGRDSNWVAAISGYYQFVALKTDGSIWEWNFDPRKRTIVDNLQQAPVQMGTHDDWAGFGALRDETVTLAADGTLWLWSKRNLPLPWGDESDLWLAPSRRPSEILNIFGSRE